MKKFLLISLIAFSFAMLWAAPKMMNFQDARNYCNDQNMRLPTASEIVSLANVNKRLNRPCAWADYMTLDGRCVIVSERCEVDPPIACNLASVMCVRK
ncbi:hypothetical protein J5690_10950 [bacterium]|nr:hypothetical protein [bacterium]